VKAILIFAFFSLSLSVWARGTVKVLVPLTPAGSFEATSTKLKGDLKVTGGAITAEKITLSTQSLKTGIDLRDEHLWKHLNYLTHPKIILSNLKAINGNATATLEVNGVSQPIVIKYESKGNTIHTRFSLKTSSFKLPKAEYLGVGVNEDITIEVEMQKLAKE
jgi:polyisoprenoid-binding protein YceI